MSDRFAAHIASREDADPAGANEETNNNENDAEQDLSSESGDDARDHQDHGDNPQQSGHRTSQVEESPTWRLSVHTTTRPGGCVHPKG